jgi:hypothetical protein
MIADSNTNREGAWKFLKGLEQHLGKNINHSLVVQSVQGSKGNYESDLVNAFILPKISEYLQQTLSPTEAYKAFLAESGDAKKKGLASGTPASAHRHLFTKVLGVSAKTLVKTWWGTSKKKPLSQSCPDWALRLPCPHKVVFECKVFRKGGMDAARTELVKSIYQCFYYRGQPKVPASGKHTGWDYDYACLVAYDASHKGCLVKAWKDVDSKVAKECWNASNIFVMVLPIATEADVAANSKGVNREAVSATVSTPSQPTEKRKIAPAANPLTNEKLVEQIRAKNSPEIAQIGEAVLSQFMGSGLKSRGLPSTVQFGADVGGSFMPLVSLSNAQVWFQIPMRAVRALGDERFVSCKQTINTIATFYRPEDVSDPTKTNALTPRYGVLDGKVEAFVQTVTQIVQTVRAAVVESEGE